MRGVWREGQKCIRLAIRVSLTYNIESKMGSWQARDKTYAMLPALCYVGAINAEEITMTTFN